MLDLDRLAHSGIDTMTPAIEPTVFAVIATLRVRFALRTSMTIDAIRIITISLIITRRHPRDLSQDLTLVVAYRIVVTMRAIVRSTEFGSLEVVNIAKLQLLHTLDLVIGNSGVHTVDAHTMPVLVDTLVQI
jgi:hypothetical protein